MEPNASVHSCIPRTSASAKLSLETETSIILVLSQKFSSFPEFWSFWVLYSPTAECYGVFAQYRFRCVLGELGRFREKTGSGKVPAGFRESSGNRSGDRLGSRFQEDRFRGSRFQEPVPSLALEVPGTSSGNRLGSTFQEPVPTGLGVRGTGSKVRISSRAGGSGTGSKVPRFQNPPRTVLGTGSGGFRGLDRFPGFEVRIGSRARGSRNRFQGSEVPKTTFRSPYVFFSPTAECYGVSAQYIFRCVLGELGRFREKTDSGKVPGGFRESSDGFRGLGPRFQGSEVPKFRGSGNRFQWVPRFG